jgi:hypothetical protein
MKTLSIILLTLLLASCDLSVDPITTHEIRITKECPSCIIELTLLGQAFRPAFEIDSTYSLTISGSQTLLIETIIQSNSDCLKKWTNRIEWYDVNGYNEKTMDCKITKHAITPKS